MLVDISQVVAGMSEYGDEKAKRELIGDIVIHVSTEAMGTVTLGIRFGVRVSRPQTTILRGEIWFCPAIFAMIFTYVSLFIGSLTTTSWGELLPVPSAREGLVANLTGPFVAKPVQDGLWHMEMEAA